jgi:very-short-patch-repair endonuclease
MRLHAQEPERALWRELRGGQLGVAFRRQVVLGNRYIADFVAPSLRLVVEVDGAVHAQRGVADARRDRDLGRLGYQILRIPVEGVMRERTQAVALVRQAVEADLHITDRESAGVGRAQFGPLPRGMRSENSLYKL